jgi:hypothetical protein
MKPRSSAAIDPSRSGLESAGDLEFVAVAERGILEAQALLLCESIRKFAGAYAKAPITIVSPRKTRRPTTATLRAFDRLDVDFVGTDIASPCPDYGPSFRVLAAALIARRPGPRFLAQLDSDTIFLRAPQFSFDGVDVLARPVDIKGICTLGGDDPSDHYWRELCRLCEVDYEAIPWVTTTVDRCRVRANYNAGLIVVRRDSGVFEKTEEILLRLVGAKRYSHASPAAAPRIGSGHVAPAGFRYWGTSQVALSLACTACGATVGLLPASYNVPLHYYDELAPIELPVHAHYHWLCDADYTANNPLADARLSLPPEQGRWLHKRLPLRPPRASIVQRLAKRISRPLLGL